MREISEDIYKISISQEKKLKNDYYISNYYT